MYIRSKVIKGHTYYYLVRGERHGKKVKQKVVQYLGKGALKPERYNKDVRKIVIQHLGNQGSSDVAPTGFKRITAKGFDETFTRAIRSLGYKVSFDLLPDHRATGVTNPGKKYVKFRSRVRASTMAHELGHAIDFSASGDDWLLGNNLSKKPEFQKFNTELKAIADYKYAHSKLRLEKLRTWRDARPEKSVALSRRIATMEKTFKSYVYNPEEMFANLFALCITEPRKARQLAPNACHWLMGALYEYPRVRKLMTEMGWWQLGTTYKVYGNDARPQKC